MNWSQTPLWSMWHDMKARCYDPNNTSYHNYGGRGIIVCDEWKNSSLQFKVWAEGNGYRPGLSLDREDNNGNYEPGNCRWILRDLQKRNKRNNRWIEAWGERKILQEWFEDPRCKVSYRCLYNRLSRGWPPEMALSYLKLDNHLR